MQLLDALPAEVLEKILDNLKDTEDEVLRNCSLAHPRLDAVLRKRKCLYLMPQVLPFIVSKIALKDVMKLPYVCPHWMYASNQFDNNVPGRLPYEKESYLKQMSTFKRDPAEDASRMDTWFLLFKCIAPDLRTFWREIGDLPDGDPPVSHLGRSAHFIINPKTWQVREIYMDKLHDFLEQFGDRFWYTKLTVSGAFTSEHTNRDEDAVDDLFEQLFLIPNVRSLDLDLDFFIDNQLEFEQLPALPHLESLSFSLHRKIAMQTVAKHVVSNYRTQLKKLKTDGMPNILAREMPSLIELHICQVRSEDIFENLKLLKAPIKKLTLDVIRHTFSVVKILNSIKHLPLHQLILRWDDRMSIFTQQKQSQLVACSSTSDKFKNLQFPDIHTLTLENCPESWCPFMGCFPSLQYFNIRHTSPEVDEQRKNIIWGKEGPHIRKMQGKDDHKSKSVCQTNSGAFPELRQVSVENRMAYFEKPKERRVSISDIDDDSGPLVISFHV